MTAPSTRVTELLLAWSEGDQPAFDQLAPLKISVAWRFSALIRALTGEGSRDGV